MIDWTYTHFRVLMRMIAPHALLYTEMQTTGAIQNNPHRALMHSAIEHPLALQIGGADKASLVASAILAEQQGFCEINLNLGCPSDKVQAGRFGACMMAEPALVADCLSSIKKAVSIPVTAKTRIGIDKQDSYLFFSTFAERLIDAGCDKLIIHARKAWLSGLNPKQNRTIPPLHYDFAYKIKEAFPTMPVVINGNINSIDDINAHIPAVDGVMLGRLACKNPYALAAIHRVFYPHSPIQSRTEIMRRYCHYLTEQFENGVRLGLLIKPMLTFAYGLPDSKTWKDCLIKAQQNKEITQLTVALNWLEQQEYRG